jgi:hypothetical protein
MTDEQVLRAQRAQALLGDDVLREAMDALRASLIEQCAVTAPSAVSLREEIWGEIRALQSVRAKLKSWATDLAITARRADRAGR